MSPLKYATTVFCAVFIAIGAASGEEVENVFGEVGGRVSFRPTSINPPVSSITWKHRNSGSVVKAIEWDDDGISILNQRFKDITTLDKKTGEITISNLTIEHSGLYTIDINSKEQGQRFNLEVLAPLPKPVIKIERSDKDPDVVYLICEYKETIIWNNSAGEKLDVQNHVTIGKFITVKKNGNLDNYYTCTLKNAVRDETSEPVYGRDLFEANQHIRMSSEESRDTEDWSNDAENSESVHWWIALIVLLILIPVLFVLLYKFWPQFHDIVYNNLKDKPCIGAILDWLDGKSTDKKNEYKQPEEEAAKCTGERMKQDEDSPSEAPLAGGEN